MSAFFTDHCTVGAIHSAVFTDDLRTVRAEIAFPAHNAGTFYTNAAFGAYLVNTTGALAALLTYRISAIQTNRTAILANFGTVTALHTVLAPCVISCTFTAKVT